MSPICPTNHTGLMPIKFNMGVYLTNPLYIRQNGPILGKIGTFRYFIDYKGTIGVQSMQYHQTSTEVQYPRRVEIWLIYYCFKFSGISYDMV